VSVPPDRARRRAGPSRRERIGRAVLFGVVAVLAFLLGVAFADTLDERPRSGGAITDVRTLTPLPQEPPARTVTVTVTSP
jgi:hypothetical protein